MARLTKSLFPVLVICNALLASEPKQPMLGQDAPDFRLEGLDGKKVGLGDFKGKYVVLHFGAGW